MHVIETNFTVQSIITVQHGITSVTVGGHSIQFNSIQFKRVFQQAHQQAQAQAFRVEVHDINSNSNSSNNSSNNIKSNTSNKIHQIKYIK
jgi:hypothetical protein